MSITASGNVGRQLQTCDLELMTSTDFTVVVISGDSINIAGHVLLNIGGRHGWYIHVAAGANEHPTVMNEHEYHVYKAFYSKKEYKRDHVYLPNPEKAILEIEKLLMDRWRWMGTFNNCTTFVEKIIRAGGGYYNFALNIPRFAGMPR